MHRLLSVLVAAVVLVYPLIVYFGVQVFEPRFLALILIVLLCLRLFLLAERALLRLQAWVVVGAFSCIAVLAIILNDIVSLKFYPVLVNGSMLAAFAYSLRHPPSAIERVARLTQPDLPPSGVAYTRRVTQVWCLFFIFNSAVAFYTALFASMDVWVLYNGFIAYILMGLLFAAEWLVRQRVLAKK